MGLREIDITMNNYINSLYTIVIDIVLLRNITSISFVLKQDVLFSKIIIIILKLNLCFHLSLIKLLF